MKMPCRLDGRVFYFLLPPSMEKDLSIAIRIVEGGE